MQPGDRVALKTALYGTDLKRGSPGVIERLVDHDDVFTRNKKHAIVRFMRAPRITYTINTESLYPLTPLQSLIYSLMAP